jgi:hypothetical protein
LWWNSGFYFSQPINSKSPGEENVLPKRLSESRLFRAVHPKRSKSMSFEKQFDDMIEAGRNVIDTDFDPVAFQQWRAHAITCLSSLMEHDHAYAKYFIKSLHSEAHPRTPECRC